MKPNAMTKHISCDCRLKFNSTTCICENHKFLKSTADTSVIMCDDTISVMDVASTKMTNIIETNVPSTASINCHSKLP